MNTPWASIESYRLTHHTTDQVIFSNCLVIHDVAAFQTFLKDTDPAACKQWLDELMMKKGVNVIHLVIDRESLVESDKPFKWDLVRYFVENMNEEKDGSIYCDNLLYVLSKMKEEIRDAIIKYGLVLKRNRTVSPEMYDKFIGLATKQGGRRSKKTDKTKKTKKAKKSKNTKHRKSITRR
jgi:hypothetical protein